MTFDGGRGPVMVMGGLIDNVKKDNIEVMGRHCAWE